jgi:L-seryl-tRNA(Ser) seleniumtransferase
MPDARRSVPSVERVTARLEPGDLPRTLAVACAREAVDDARARAAAGVAIHEDAVVEDAATRLDARRAELLQPVINTTGVILHTNLGRAPVPAPALSAGASVGSGYSNLEYDLNAGVRRSRHAHAASLLAGACGAEAGMVVNNNAAAVLLVLATLARDREVVVGRGELVEIGGGFRIPEILAESGARLHEVGTTNRTRQADYEAAIGVDTALILKVHASNYRMVGFVESASVPELAALGPPLVLDAGSGLLDETTPWLPKRPAWLRDEPGVRQAVEAGAALVTFSGDKLLGGPQAGIIVGRRALIDRLARHPLARAVRADKLTLATLQSVALAYVAGDATSIPVWRMATIPLEQLHARAEVIAAAVPGAKVTDTEAVAGGGSLPGLTIPSVGVTREVGDTEGALARLRKKGIVARAGDGAVVCDLRTVDPAHDGRLATALAEC